MDIPVAGGPNLGKARIDRGGLPVIRRHFRFGILIHAVDGDAHSPRHLAGDGDIAHGAHGIDLALGIRRNIDGRMIARMFFIRVDTRIVQESPAVFVVIRNSSRALEIEVVLAPSHADAGAHSCDAGSLQFLLVIDPAVLSGNCNRAVFGSGNVRVVDLRAKSLLVARGTNGRISHGAADAHFFAANGNTARHGGLFRQFLSRDGKRLQVIQRSVCPVLLAVDDAFRVADAPVDSHGSHGTRKGLADIHVHAACHGQRLAQVRSGEVDRGHIGQDNGIARQIGPRGVVEGVIGKGQAHGHALSSRHLSGDIDDGSGGLRLFADIFPCNGVVFKGNFGIVLQVVPAAGTGPVERLASNGNTRAHGNDEGVADRLAVHGVRSYSGVFDIRRDVVLHIVVGNARACTGITVPASAHGGGDGDTMILAQFVFGVVLIACGIAGSSAGIGIRGIIVERGCYITALIEITRPRGVESFVFQGFLVRFLCLCLFVQGVIRLFLQVCLYLLLCPAVKLGVVMFGIDFVGIAVNAFINIVINLRFLFVELRIGRNDRDFSCLDIHCAAIEARYGGAGNIGMGIVLHAAVSKSAFEAVASFGPCQRAVDLGGTLLGLHIYRGKDRIVSADDSTGQVVFQIADSHGAAHAHAGVCAASFCPRKTARNLEVSVGGLIGNRSSHYIIINHQGMNILFGPIVIYNPGAVDIRAVAVAGAGSHARRYFDADLSC